MFDEGTGMPKATRLVRPQRIVHFDVLGCFGASMFLCGNKTRRRNSRYDLPNTVFLVGTVEEQHVGIVQ